MPLSQHLGEICEVGIFVGLPVAGPRRRRPLGDTWNYILNKTTHRARGHSRRGNALQGMCRAGRDRWAEARAAYHRALELDPKNETVRKALESCSEGLPMQAKPMQPQPVQPLPPAPQPPHPGAP